MLIWGGGEGTWSAQGGGWRALASIIDDYSNRLSVNTLEEENVVFSF